MNLVIPVKEGTKSIELIYAIRSCYKHLIGLSGLIILGRIDTRLQSVRYGYFSDDKSSKYKERNIYRKLLYACKDDRVSEDFVFSNDDIFLNKDFDIHNLPYYNKGYLIETMAKNMGDYRKSLNHSRKYLMSKELPTMDYDTHFPIVYNKQKFLNTFVCSDLNWDQPFGYVIKSLYANSNAVDGEYIGDCKIQQKMSYEELKQKIANKPFFSTADGVINDDMIRLLNELYPTKSIYEK